MRRRTWIVATAVAAIIVALGYLLWPEEVAESTLPGATTEESAAVPGAAPPDEPTALTQEPPSSPPE